MERISNLLPETAQQNLQQQKSSEVGDVTSRTKIDAMGEVLDAWRRNLGWNPLDQDSLDLDSAAWVTVLDTENVPPSAYPRLYVEALNMRAAMMRQGKNPPDMGVELFLACWSGPNGLQVKMRQEQIEQRNTLAANAEGGCQKCFGTGLEQMPDKSVRPGCDHMPAEANAL